jgi:hypothetical protein
MTVLCLLLPLATWAYLYLARPSLPHPPTASLTTNQRLSPAPLLSSPLFLLRRLLFSLTALLLPSAPLLQLLSLNLSSLLLLCYILSVRPFSSPALNQLEAFNEASIYMCSVPCLMFTEIGEGGMLEYQIGWAVIGVVTLNIVVNIIVLAVENVKGLRAQCRKRCKRNVVKKEVSGKDQNKMTQNLA